MAADIAQFFAQAGAYMAKHKEWFIGGAAVLGALLLCVVIAAAAGAFATAPALSTVPAFVLVSITDSAGAADANTSVLGTYTQIELSAYTGPQIDGEEIVAAWQLVAEGQTAIKYFTYAKVTATGKYIKHIISSTAGATSDAILSTEPADAAARVPLDGKGTWSRVNGNPTNPRGPRTLVFQAPAAVSLLRTTAQKTKLAISTVPLGLHRNGNAGYENRHTASAAPRIKAPVRRLFKRTARVSRR
jgi:hypothetical protein